jgi:hypothetical protein
MMLVLYCSGNLIASSWDKIGLISGLVDTTYGVTGTGGAAGICPRNLPGGSYNRERSLDAQQETCDDDRS